jgi:parallel beta-helix repeat protein
MLGELEHHQSEIVEDQEARMPLRQAFVRRTVVALVAVVTAMIAGSPARAATTTLFVDSGNTACSDTGAGTADQPFCKISAAAARVTAGQTVQVASGNYPEQVTVKTSGVGGAPVTFTAAPGATVTVGAGQTDAFYLSSKSWITINGFSVVNTTGYGIAVNYSSQITLSNNHVSYSGQPVSGYTKYGIRLNSVTDSVVSHNQTDHNTNAGIGLVSGSTGNLVIGNASFRNAMQFTRSAAGIHLYDAPGNTVTENISYDNEDSGINIYPGSSDCIVTNNVTYDNGDHGIDDSFAPNATIIANSVYHNVTAGINVEGGSTGTRLENNIAVDNGIKSPRTHSDIRVEKGSTDGTTLDYDLVYLSSADTLLIWNSVSYTSLSAFQAASGQEAHGLQVDPHWTDPINGDFHLLAGSPGIDSADSGAPAQPPLDIERKPRVDDPATPNTGTGPLPYVDRGAYEYQAAMAGTAPVARLTVNTNSGMAPLAVTANASTSTGSDSSPIASYQFDFGDGSTAVGPQADPTASHTYTAPGSYALTVVVTNDEGLSSMANATVQVTADQPPAASLSVTPPSGALNLSVTASGGSSTDTDGTPIATYQFIWGDGSPATEPQPGATATHTYTSVGTYTVTLAVTDTAGLVSTSTASVTVVDKPPTVSLSVSSTSGALPLTVSATASATDTDATPVASYRFDWGDGSAVVVQSTQTASHVYRIRGTFTLRVTVTDTAGNATTATRKIKAG